MISSLRCRDSILKYMQFVANEWLSPLKHQTLLLKYVSEKFESLMAQSFNYLAFIKFSSKLKIKTVKK